MKKATYFVLIVFSCGLFCCSSSVPPSSETPSPSVRETPQRKASPRIDFTKQATFQRLGDAPLCEASAALRAPWDPNQILVADNEVQGALYGFAMKGGTLVGQERLKIKGKDDPDDMEALADAGGGEVLVVGSHSRSSSCKKRPERQRLKWVSWDPSKRRLKTEHLAETQTLWESAMESVESCQARLFVNPLPEGAEALCKAWVKADKDASKKRCTTLDIEGAVGVPTQGKHRLWLGLRKPTSDGLAALIRLAPSARTLLFDAVVWVDLKGASVRELAWRDGHVWGIAGPVRDKDEAFRLWYLDAAELGKSGARVDAVFLRYGELPPSSEGLIFDGEEAVVIVDGGEGDSEDVCDTHSGQMRVHIKTP